MAFLFALVSCRLFVLLLLDRELLLLLAKSGSPFKATLGTAGSLFSLFIPGTDVVFAQRISAIILLGPLETLRLDCCSVDNARCRVLGLPGVGRLVTAPGFCSCLLDDLLEFLDMEGLIMTGPPSFRLMESQSSGSRCEKLVKR